jgi:hypothetical protein
MLKMRQAFLFYSPFFFPYNLYIFLGSPLPFDSEAEKISLNCQEQRERTSEKHPGKHPQKHAPTKASSMGFVICVSDNTNFCQQE